MRLGSFTVLVCGAVGIASLLGACAHTGPEPGSAPQTTVTVTAEPGGEATPEPVATVTVSPFDRPADLGTVELALGDNGLAHPVATPDELRDRRLAPREGAHPDPATDEWFAQVSPVPQDVLARSSWLPECPVAAQDLAYIVMPFWGFDMRPHTGEMITAEEHAQALVTVFERMYAQRFPIEEMRVTTWDEVNGPHTGDLNVTISFECRKVTGGFDRWSQHASGLAVDINPFHNPWVRDGFVFPELASAYMDRAWLRPGMIETQREIVTDFEEVGWAWGGAWTDLDDWMHFSANDL